MLLRAQPCTNLLCVFFSTQALSPGGLSWNFRMDEQIIYPIVTAYRVGPQPLLSTRTVYILKFASEPVEQEREYSKHQYNEALHLRQAPALLSLQSKWKRENKPHCTFFVFLALSSETNRRKTKTKVLPLEMVTSPGFIFSKSQSDLIS